MMTFHSDIPMHARFVLLTMGSLANGNVVTIGHAEIAERTGMSPRTVYTAIQVLIEMELIQVLDKSKRGKPTTYRVHSAQGVAA